MTKGFVSTVDLTVGSTARVEACGTVLRAHRSPTGFWLVLPARALHGWGCLSPPPCPVVPSTFKHPSTAFLDCWVSFSSPSSSTEVSWPHFQLWALHGLPVLICKMMGRGWTCLAGMRYVKCSEYLLQKMTHGSVLPCRLPPLASFAHPVRGQSPSYTNQPHKYELLDLGFLKFQKQLNNFAAVAVLGFCHEPVGAAWLWDLPGLFQNLDWWLGEFLWSITHQLRAFDLLKSLLGASSDSCWHQEARDENDCLENVGEVLHVAWHTGLLLFFNYLGSCFGSSTCLYREAEGEGREYWRRLLFQQGFLGPTSQPPTATA